MFSLHFATKISGALLALFLLTSRNVVRLSKEETLMRNLFLVATVILSFALQQRPASAEALLTVVSGDEQIKIQRDDLATLKTATITTGTDWTDGVSTFKGPLVRDVLELAGVKGGAPTTVSAKAANDYSVDIPIEDFRKYNVILATEMDDKPLTLRDKGPLWIIYPRDDHSELDDPAINARWIWQLVELGIE